MFYWKSVKMKLSSCLLIISAIAFSLAGLNAHCQVPCGIYDDNARVRSMLEDVKTVHKAMVQIGELSKKDDALSINQKVRWVNNKESHAQSIITTISDYFLTQRVKSSQKDYSTRLQHHHAVVLLAMKCKQVVDAKKAQELAQAIEVLLKYYPDSHHH